MQSESPSQMFVWGELASGFESDLILQQSDIWQLSGLEEEYGGPASGDRNREIEQRALIAELAGVLVQAVICELEDRLLSKSSGRRAGRPRDVITPYLGPKLLSVFLRCHNRAGRQSVITSLDGKLKQREAGRLHDFIKTVIRPLNYYLTTELQRTALSAPRLARYALDDRRRTARKLERSRANALAKEAADAETRQLLPSEIALQEIFAIPK
jgi:hypothetical protein